MNIAVDYYIRRKSDKKIMLMRHVDITEADILAFAEQEATAPMWCGNPKEEDCEYEFCDFTIAETRI
jgi:hypothetical protein